MSEPSGFDLLHREEDLDPDFERWINQHESLGTCIQHPLYYSIMHHPQLNAVANHCLREKKKAVAAAWNEGRWGSYIILHERPWRFEALTRIAHKIAEITEYWELVRFVWIDSENVWQYHQDWIELFNARDRPEQWRLMEPDELEGLHAMSSSIPVFRGTPRRDRVEGLSWTLDREKAEWFAERWDSETPVLVEGYAPKHLVIAYFNSRDEEEIVIYPDDVTNKEVIELCS